MEWMELGPAPAEEDCAQIGREGYRGQALDECRAWREQLLRAFGPLPDGMRLRVRAYPHDLGTYYEVAVGFDPSDRAQLELALRMEGEAPGRWDDGTRREREACRRG